MTAVAVGDRYRGDLRSKHPRLLGADRLLMTGQGELILLLAGNMVTLVDILRRDPHRVVTVDVLEGILLHGIDQGAMAEAIAAPGLFEDVGGVGHALHSPSNNDPGLTRLDQARR